MKGVPPRGVPNCTGLRFQALQWRTRDEYGHYTVYISGVSQEGNPVTVKTKFNPFIYVKLPDHQESIETFVNYKVRQKCENQRWIKRRIGQTLAWEVIYRTDLAAGFTGKESRPVRFAKLTFKSGRTMMSTVRMLAKEFPAYQVYEASLDPHIRLAHLSNCEMTGWIDLNPDLVEYDTSNGRHIMITLSDWRGLKGVELAEIAPFRFCSFDLECAASAGQFPDYTKRDNPILQIGVTLKDTVETRFLFNLGPCNDIEGANVKCAATERDLLTDFAEFLREADPDIVHGWNIYGFDFPYLVARAKMNDCWHEYESLSRIPGFNATERVTTLKSNAYGANEWTVLDMPGRFVLDSMVYFKRAPQKMRSYALNAVSKYYLSTPLKRDPLKCAKGSKLVRVRHPKHGFKVGDCVNLEGVPTPSLKENDDGKRVYTWAGWTYEELHDELHEIVTVESEDEYFIEMSTPSNLTSDWAGGTNVRVFESKNDISFDEMNRAFCEGDAAVMTEVGKYCIQDTLLPQRLLDTQCVLSNLIEMSKVTWVPIDYLITRGQQVKVFSQICRAAYKKGIAVPAYKFHHRPDEDVEHSGYEGGAVLDPKVGFHTEPIAVPDYKSLYPSLMVDFKLCYLSLVKDPQYLNLPGVRYFTHTVKYKGKEHVNVFATNGSSLLPEILANLLDARIRRKAMMGKAKTKMEKAIHNGAQLALKVSANSIYGFTGVNPESAFLPEKRIAETTTGRGRWSTFFARDYAIDLKNFEKVMQCDTHFPIYYAHHCEFANGRRGLLTTKDLIRNRDVKVWGTEGFTTITDITDQQGRSVKPTDEITVSGPINVGEETRTLQLQEMGDWEMATFQEMYQVHLAKGKPYDLKNYDCDVVYGDTDSIFTKFDVSHLAEPLDQWIYSMVVAAYISFDITHQLRMGNPHTPYREQRMELEYEKVYRRLLLFSKKRYDGDKFEMDPRYVKGDAMGTAGKRRDFCSFTCEIYDKVTAAVRNPDIMDKETLVKNAMRITKGAIQDVFNSRVPINKLVLSRNLNDEYKQSTKKLSKKKANFTSKTVFEGDVVNLRKRKREDDSDDWKIVRKENKGLGASLFAENLATQQTRTIHYNQITRRDGKTITLAKIMDPATTEEELAGVTAPHARLARTMNLRDPASAPSSGQRRKFIQRKPDNPGDKQYMCAEDYEYAVKHNIDPDPMYYVKNQLQNPLKQILETVEPGVSKRMFDDAYCRYELRSSGQPQIGAGFSKEIKLDGTLKKPNKDGRGKRGPGKPKLAQVTKAGMAAFFGKRA